MLNIYGHEKTKKLFSNIINKGNIVNSYLFIGDYGLGKSFMAKYFAMMVNCLNKVQKPCFNCAPCIQMISGNHPDVFFVKPDGNSIKVDTIKNLIKEVYEKPYNSKRKIFIINEAEKMTDVAQNSILKTLEEPSLYSLFILTASNLEGLLPTIISRCEKIRFTRETDETIKEYLINEKNLDENRADKIAMIANGNYGMANLFLDPIYTEMRDELFEIMHKIIVNGDIMEKLDSYEFFEANKDKIDIIIKFLISYFRDILVYQSTKSEKFIKNNDKIKEISLISTYLTGLKVNNIINKIKELNLNIKSNVNFRMSIEDFLLNI